jgi:hypothetical protein
MAWRRMGEEGKGGSWVLRAAMSVWKPTLGGQGASWRSALASKSATGRREEGDAGGKKKEEKGERKGELAPCLFGKKEEGSGSVAAEGGGLCLRPLAPCERGGGAEVMTTAMTAGRFGAARRHERQALTTAATRRSATTARARGKQRAARRI